MIRVANQIEKNSVCLWLKPIILGVGVAQDVLPSISGDGQLNTEYIARYIQNTGTNPTFYSFGRDCQLLDYCGSLAASQQLDISNFGGRVSCYSPLGTTIALTVIKRGDLEARETIHTGNQ